jgi:hypothetical protein
MKPANRDPWPFSSQCASCGLEPPIIAMKGWMFPKARLFVHRCEKKACPECQAAKLAGWGTMRVSEAEINNGRALEKVAGRLPYLSTR